MDFNDHMRQFETALRETNDLETAWSRHILTMAAGVLALTVSLVSSIPESALAEYLLLATWALLVVAVCSGCAATYGQINAMRRAVRDYAEKLNEARITGRHVETVNVAAAPWFGWMQPVMIVAFILSVLFLTGYGIITIRMGRVAVL